MSVSAQDPLERFAELLAQAKGVYGDDYNGMTVTTVGPEGRPSSRIVLLKSVDARGFVFYTNLNSRKGRELAAHPWTSLCFWWSKLESQVRVQGKAARVSDEEADAYFATRARSSQIGAWASLQSEVLPDRAVLDARVADFERRFEGGPVPRPPHWSGFLVTPYVIEFWKNRPSRLHDREVYRRERDTEAWQVDLLYP